MKLRYGFLHYFIIGLLFLAAFSCSTDEDSVRDLDIEETDASVDENEDDQEAEEDNQTEDETEDSTEEEEPQDEEEENEDDTAEDPVISVPNGAVNTYGKLQVDGNKIYSENTNEPVQLRGMSYFWSQWSEGAPYYNANVVKWLKDDWNINIIRAAMGVEDSGGYISNPEVEKQKVFAVVDAAIEQNIYVIIDWHSHHAENYTDQAKTFFTEVAQKYGDYPNIIYETYNEPIFQGNNSAWSNILKPYHEEVISEIRKYDTNNLIVCGTRSWSQAVSEVIGNEIDDDNVAYTLHYYSSTHFQGEYVWQEAERAINAGLPLFVTEYGVSQADGGGVIMQDQAQNWWKFLDQNKISWCNWSISNKSEASAALQPWASVNGGWSTNDLTQSGNMVRNEILAKN